MIRNDFKRKRKQTNEGETHKLYNADRVEVFYAKEEHREGTVVGPSRVPGLHQRGCAEILN